jgi:hypothetical protein
MLPHIKKLYTHECLVLFISVDFMIDASYGANYLVTGDFDGDGKLDIAVANLYANYITIFRNTATSGNLTLSSFAAAINISTGDGSNSICVGDLDRDGKPILLLPIQTRATRTACL